MPLFLPSNVLIYVMHVIKSSVGLRRTRARTQGNLQSRFTELYLAHSPEATRLAYVLTRDSNSAEELVQAAFVKVFARFRDKGPVENFRAYLRRAVVNTWKSEYRRGLRTTPLDPGVVNQLPDQSGMSIDQIAEADRVWRGLMNLVARQRAAVLLRYFEHLSYAEIAATLSTSEGAVRSLLRNALRKLRSTLEMEG